MLNLIPGEVRQGLALIQRVQPEAVIAGGYLRDLAHGIEPKDVDVFFPTTRDMAAANFAAMAQGITRRVHTPSQFDIEEGAEYDDGAMDGDLVAQFEVVKYDEHDPTNDIYFNLVGLRQDLDTPRAILGRIDFGLCQVGFDGHSVLQTPAFISDRDNKTFTFTLVDASPRQQQSSQRRWLRLREKYPEHTLVGLVDPTTVEF